MSPEMLTRVFIAVTATPLLFFIGSIVMTELRMRAESRDSDQPSEGRTVRCCDRSAHPTRIKVGPSCYSVRHYDIDPSDPPKQMHWDERGKPFVYMYEHSPDYLLDG